jgi:site-specific DNA recombinase
MHVTIHGRRNRPPVVGCGVLGRKISALLSDTPRAMRPTRAAPGIKSRAALDDSNTVDPRGYRLAVNSDEAAQVRAIFGLYLEHEALLPVVRELEARGWHNKRWVAKSGQEKGGDPFTKTSLHRLLTNPLYAGLVRYKDELHDGEHPAIVDPVVFRRAQDLLRRNGRTGGAPVRNQFGVLLKGLLRCGPCGCAMTPAHTTKGEKRYRYYVCSNAQKKGWGKCPSKSVPAAEIEDLVVGRIRCVGADPDLAREVLAEARRQDEARVAELEAEGRTLARDLSRWHAEVGKLAALVKPGEDNGPVVARLADLHERIGLADGRAQRLREQVKSIHDGLVRDEEATLALSAFDPVWGALTPKEQARVVALLVEGVTYDGAAGTVSIAFRPTGIKTLADELAAKAEGRSA